MTSALKEARTQNTPGSIQGNLMHFARKHKAKYPGIY